MQTRILTLFARTPVHVGAGNSVGAIDSPVMRERHTRIPIVPGSSLKGVLRDLWSGDDDRLWLFGNEQGESDQDRFRAGALLIGEARVLAFPVRSAKGGFAWITCPLALARFKRDAGAGFHVPTVADDNACLAGKGLLLEEKVVLEEYCLVQQGEPDGDTLAALRELSGDEVWQEMDARFVVVSDEMFSYFVEHACEVVTRVRIDDRTGTVAGTVAGGALFNQENVPSETLFYTAIAAQNEKGKDGNQGREAEQALDALGQKLAAETILQIGGDETIGLGFCTVRLANGKEN
jgi:CRISPR-associated protein Cmr4